MPFFKLVESRYNLNPFPAFLKFPQWGISMKNELYYNTPGGAGGIPGKHVTSIHSYIGYTIADYSFAYVGVLRVTNNCVKDVSNAGNWELTNMS